MEKIGRKLSALLLTDLVAIPIREVLSSFVNSGSGPVSEDDVFVITQCNTLQGKFPIESASLDIIISVLQTPDLVNEQWLEEINRVLKPSGKIVVQLSLKSSEQFVQSSLERKLLIAGFVDVAPLESKAVLVLDSSQSLTIIGKKASWSVGSSFVIKKATKALPKLIMDDESDLIDEDSLLTEEDLKKPQVPSVSDCEIGSTRKACKNCTCGRAEAEQKVQLELTAEQINNPQSACGSCGLGDAFRCSGCPYKGLPPFKLGEKDGIRFVRSALKHVSKAKRCHVFGEGSVCSSASCEKAGIQSEMQSMVENSGGVRRWTVVAWVVKGEPLIAVVVANKHQFIDSLYDERVIPCLNV